MNEKELLKQILAVSIMNLQHLQTLISQQAKPMPFPVPEQDARFLQWIEMRMNSIIAGLEKSQSAG